MSKYYEFIGAFHILQILDVRNEDMTYIFGSRLDTTNVHTEVTVDTLNTIGGGTNTLDHDMPKEALEYEFQDNEKQHHAQEDNKSQKLLLL